MVWRRVRRRFGISAPRLAVRPHIPWYLRWSLVVPFVLAALGLAWWAFASGMELAGFHRSEAEHELAQLREQVASFSALNADLNDRVAQYERKLQIEHASNEESMRQLKLLSDENARLQGDLSFFENLTAVRGKEGELGIHRLRLDPESMPGEYRVRMLLVQSGQRAKEFRGRYQLVVTLMEQGERKTRAFPESKEGNAPFELFFKYYQRIEQTLRLPADAVLESVQVRVFEQGVAEPRAKQSVDLG